MLKSTRGGVIRRLLFLGLFGWGVWYGVTQWWPLHNLERTSAEIEAAVNKDLVAAGVHDSLVLSQVRTVHSKWGVSWVETDRSILLQDSSELPRLTQRLSGLADRFHCRLRRRSHFGSTEFRVGFFLIEFQNIFFVGSVPKEAAAPKAVSIPLSNATAEVAFVIDDVSSTLEPMNSFVALGVPLTFAILPRDRHCRELAEKAHRLGYPVILHLPMEPIDLAHNDPGSAGLFMTMTSEQLHLQYQKDVASVPYMVGINNHMGSAFTQDISKMTIVMPWVKQSNYFFLDSRTSPRSVVCKVAKQFGVPCRANDTFLDNADDVAAIEHQLDQVLKIALRDKRTIAIGHYRRRHLVEALAAKLPEFKAHGVAVVALPSFYL